MLRISLIFIVLLSVFVSVPAWPEEEELELINRPMAISGLTGLLYTTSPYTAAPGTVEIGTSVLYENGTKPDFTLTEYPLIITAGIGGSQEAAIRCSFFTVKTGPTATQTIDRKTGDLNFSYKWNFKPQRYDSAVPGVAFIMTGSVPLEKETDTMVSSAKHWKLMMGLSAGSEISWRDHVFALYADVRAVGQDLTEKRLSDKYGIFNAGVLFPISKYRNLQMFIEYAIQKGMDHVPVNGGDDYDAFTYGLRLVSTQFNLTMASQFIHKKSEVFDNSTRLSALMSFKF